MLILTGLALLSAFLTLFAILFFTIPAIARWININIKGMHESKEIDPEMTSLLKGLNGDLEVYEDRVVLNRQTKHGKMMFGKVIANLVIPIKDIEDVGFEPGGIASNGIIQIYYPESARNAQGVMSAMSRENAIVYKRKHNQLAEEVVEDIENLRRQSELRNSKKHENKIKASDTEEIRRYKDLLDDGIITEEEFELKKRQLLNI